MNERDARERERTGERERCTGEREDWREMYGREKEVEDRRKKKGGACISRAKKKGWGQLHLGAAKTLLPNQMN